MAPPESTRIGKDKAMSFEISTMLTVVVGKEPNEKRFLVHEGFVCARSEFFRRAMNGPWVERDERLIKLPEDDPEIFATYINLVYTNNIATVRVERPMDATRINAENVFLAKLYVLSEKLCDSVAKNTVISAFFAVGLETTSTGYTYYPGRDSVKLIYAGTPRGSPARRMLADIWTGFSLEKNYFAACQDELPKDFWFELALALRKDRSSEKNVATKNGAAAYMENVE